MASYHLTMKNGKSAGTHADYITRENQYSRGEKAEELVCKQSGNMPSWAENPSDFWKAADAHERANGRTYTEIEVALPNELTPEQREQLVRDFVKQEVGADHAYTWAIHEKAATLDKEQQNPHAHIMICERKHDGIERDKELYFRRANKKNPELGGCAKDRENWHRRDKPTELREHWAELQNKALEREGYDIKVDHRTLADQREDALKRGDHDRAAELDRAPEYHLGPRRANNPADPDRQDILAYRDTRRELLKMQQQLRELEQQIARRDRAAQHIDFAPTKITVADLSAEAAEHRQYLSGTIEQHKKAVDRLDADERALYAPHRATAINSLLTARFAQQEAALSVKIGQRDKLYAKLHENGAYGKFERLTGFGQYGRDRDLCEKLTGEIQTDQKRLATDREKEKIALERGMGGDSRIAEEIKRREPTVAAQVGKIGHLRQQHNAEIKRLAEGNKSARDLVNAVARHKNPEKVLTVPLPRDGNGQRVRIAAAAKVRTPGLIEKLAKAAAQIEREAGLTRGAGLKLHFDGGDEKRGRGL